MKSVECITVIATAGYVLFLLVCLAVWLSKPKVAADFGLHPEVTVVIPARNEADKIAAVLEGVLKQDYPRKSFHVVVVDDHSTDETKAVCNKFSSEHPSFPLQLVSLTDASSKKAAINTAVGLSDAEWVVTIDADVHIPSSRWLSEMMAHTGGEADLICGPVLSLSFSHPSSGVFQRLTELESIGLTAIAAAGIKMQNPFYCNGANLAFRRSSFLKVNGYSGSTDSLSGDDTTLLMKFRPTAVRYVQREEALVCAAPQRSGSGFLSQRQRWASKIPHSLSKWTLFISSVAWTAHAGLVLCYIGLLSGKVDFTIPIALMSIKGFVEWVLLKVVGRFFRRPVFSVLILILQPLYALAITIIGIASVFVPYHWKGRTSR